MFGGCGVSRSLGSCSTRLVVFLGWGFKELSCCGAVSDRCGFVEAEHDGQVERVRAVGECFVELPVDAEGFQGGCLAAEWCGECVFADRSGG